MEENKNKIDEIKNDAGTGENEEKTADKAETIAALKESARTAAENEDYARASICYAELHELEPGSWEPAIYSKIYQTASGALSEFIPNAVELCGGFNEDLKLVKESFKDETTIKEILKQLEADICWLADIGTMVAKKDYAARNTKANPIIQTTMNYYIRAINIGYNFGDAVVAVFGNDYAECAVNAWKRGLEIHLAYIKHLRFTSTAVQIGVKDRYLAKIRQIDPAYKEPKVKELKYFFK